MGLRQSLYRQLEPSVRERGISTINVFIVVLVLLSFLTFSLETESTTPAYVMELLGYFNIFILGVFAIEYLVRLWIAGEDPEYRGLGGRLRYMVKPYALADFLAFAPELDCDAGVQGC